MIFDPLELNYSKLKAYLDCPFLYRFIYVDRRYARQTSFSSIGLSVHKALAAYHAGGRDLADLMACYQDNWLHQGYASAQESMEFYRRGAEVLEGWWRYAQDHPAETIYWEKRFDFRLGKWLIKGTVDRIDRLPDGTVEVLDYKMGFEGRTAGDAASSLQLSIYALGAERGLGLKVSSTGYMVLTDPRKLAVPYDAASGEKTLAFIKETGERMLALDMYRKGECARCVIRNSCPESSARDSRP
jgi:RecB family exonuclease